MSEVNETYGKLIGTCIQLETVGDLIWVTDCQSEVDSQQITISGLNTTRQTVKMTIEKLSLKHMATRIINHETFFNHIENCPLCGQSTDKARKLFTVTQLFWEISVLQCYECGLSYKEFAPNGVLLNHIYGSEYEHFSEVDDIGNEIQKYRSRVNRMGKPRGRHLDYGCGAGHLVACSLQAGWDSYGADPYLPNLPVSKSLVGRLFRLDVTNSDARHELGGFDCITLWAVFEHLSPLRETLAALVSMLNPGGQLILNAPNSDSLIARRSGNNWRIAVLLEHLQFCSPSFARLIANQHKLTIGKMRFTGSPFPFGTGQTDASGQGLRSLPTEFVTIIEDENTNQVVSTKASCTFWYKFLLAPVYQRLMSKGGTGFFSVIIRQTVHLLRFGDHIEIVFIRPTLK